jgi:redox-sensitive bicupin YhaK (pirin superfamily)
MITIRRSEERKQIESDNQKTWMTFDAENLADPLKNGFGVLKIFNEEILKPGRTFVFQTQKDMVVVTYINEGLMIFNRPQQGKSGLMSAGDFLQTDSLAGMKQYSLNASPTDDARMFQSGFAPGTGVAEPGGENKRFTLAERKGILKLIASPDGKEDSLRIRQDVEMYSTLIHKGNHIIHELKPGRTAWLHVVKGKIDLNELHLLAGDGAGFSDEAAVSFTAQEPTEILLFDLAGQVPGEGKPAPASRAKTNILAKAVS